MLAKYEMEGALDLNFKSNKLYPSMVEFLMIVGKQIFFKPSILYSISVLIHSKIDLNRFFLQLE